MKTVPEVHVTYRTVPEFRVTYRREGGQRQYRLFQKLASVTRFLTDLQKADRVDLAPLAELTLETRECGAWSQQVVVIPPE